MFDKQSIRKNVIIILCIIGIILAIMFIRRAFSRYESQADSTIDADLAFWVVNDSLQDDDVWIGDIASGEEKDVVFTVSNYNESISAKVPIEFDIRIDATTNMPLKYSIYKRVDGNDVEWDADETIYTDEDGTYYKSIVAEGFSLKMVKEDDDKETQTFVLRITFPSYNEDGINDGAEDDENWQFADLVEYLRVSIDARQKIYDPNAVEEDTNTVTPDNTTNTTNTTDGNTNTTVTPEGTTNTTNTTGGTTTEPDNSEDTEETTLIGQIKGNESTAYGAYVNYPIDINNDGIYTNDWQIFYHNGNNIFLIAAEMVPNSMISDGVVTIGNTGIDVYWQSSNYTKTTIDSTIASKYMFNNGLSKTSHYAYKAVASLLNTSNWENFRNSSYAESVIGGPTLEMFAASWNQKYAGNSNYATLSIGYDDDLDGNGGGYSINGNGSIVSSSLLPGGQSAPLYFRSGALCYWLASLSTFNSLLGADRAGSISNNEHWDPDYGGIRPVIALYPEVEATYESGVWKLK